jgi:hypothetical protein
MAGEFTAEVREIVTNRSGGRCELCEDPAWEPHHRHPRKSGGSKREWLGWPSNALDVCRLCHNLIESRRNLSYKLGWLVPEGFDPSYAPVLYRGRYVLLGVDGSVKETA